MTPAHSRTFRAAPAACLAAAALFLAACGAGGGRGGAGAGGYATAKDLRGKKIGVMLGSSQDLRAAEIFPQARVVQFNSPADAINALESGQVDAYLEDEVYAAAILRKNGELAVLEKDLFVEPLGIGFRKDRAGLREDFNAFLKELRKSGEYDRVYKRWIESPGPAPMPDLGPPGTGGEITLGTSNVGLPFATVIDGEFAGFDIEVMGRFAASRNMRLAVRDISFSGLISALAAGKVDVIACCITITEERKKEVDFSDPYFESGTLAIVLKRAMASPGGAAGARTAPFFQGVADSFYDNIVREGRYLLILDGLEATVVISVLSLLLGTLLGAVVCFMRMSRSRALSFSARWYITVLRGMPVLVLLMIVFYVVFASVDIDPTLAAVITFGLNFAAYVSEMFRMAVCGVDPGQVEAGVALGLTRFQTFLYVVLPQAARQVLPVYKGEFISMVKMTSVVGYIAVQDLTKAGDIIRSRTFDAFFPLVMVAVLYFLIIYAMTASLAFVERSLDRGAGRGRGERRAQRH